MSKLGGLALPIGFVSFNTLVPAEASINLLASPNGE